MNSEEHTSIGDNAIIDNSEAPNCPGILTIGPEITIQGKNGEIRCVSDNDSVVNEGLIKADTAGAAIWIEAFATRRAGVSDHPGGIRAIASPVSFRTGPRSLHWLPHMEWPRGCRAYQAGGRFDRNALGDGRNE